MIWQRVLLHRVELDEKPRETGDGPCEKRDEVAFADARVLGALGEEVLVFRVAVEFFAVPRFGEGVVLDVLLVLVAECEGG